MRKTIQFGSLIVLLFVSAVHVQAQKFGYVNTAAILSEMPEVKQAEVDIQNYEAQLKKKAEAKVKELQDKYAPIQERMAAGDMSPKEQQDVQLKFQQDQTELAKMEQEMVGQIQKKRQDVLQPIYDKINKAISTVAKENGFTMIFDQAVLLYSEETADVGNLVKAKLGL